MRYPRNAKIFRGQIDAAPFAGLFFLLVLMLFIFSSHVFIPGVKVVVEEKEPAPEMTVRTLKLLPGLIQYRGEEHDLESFERLLRQQARMGSLPGHLRFLADPKVPPETVQKVENLALELGIRLRPPGNRLQLPEDPGFPGTPGPAVIVGVNLNGQIFYQHQRIQTNALREKLAALKDQEGPVSVVLQADKQVPLEQIMQVLQIVGSAGVSDVTIGSRPSPRQ